MGNVTMTAHKQCWTDFQSEVFVDNTGQHTRCYYWLYWHPVLMIGINWKQETGHDRT